MLNPDHPWDYDLWEIGLYLLDAMDVNLAAAQQVLTLTEEGLPPSQLELVQKILREARRELNMAEIANAAAHHHYRVGASHESLDRTGALEKKVAEQSERLPDHLERVAVRHDEPIPGRQDQARRVVQSARMIHEQAAVAIGLIRQDDGPRNTKTMLQAIIWQAVLAVERTGRTIRHLPELR